MRALIPFLSLSLTQAGCGVGGGNTRPAALGGSSDPGSAVPVAGGGADYAPGPAGCGLEAAAFCDTFDAPARGATRAGELDGKKWSLARMCEIGSATHVDGEAVAIGSATVPTCRSDLPAQVFPSADTLICDGNALLQSNHLLVLVAAQNYGQNSYRIRQPFDFADRTGQVVFDAEGFNLGNQGWISLEITEDPAPAPSFTFHENFENGSIPRNAVEIQFGDNCGDTGVGITDIIVYDDFHQNRVLTDPRTCVAASEGRLNRFRVALSRQRIEVYATPASTDGVTFGAPVLIGSADINLPFARGHVHITGHNHATLKYSQGGSRDAWRARWDNVGFDGPAITRGWREYEALDALDRTPGGKVNVGWRMADEGQKPAPLITISGVDPNGATRARLALQNWTQHFPRSKPNPDYAINYRLNGRAWKTRRPTPSELRMMRDLPNAGTRSFMLDVDVVDLVAGDNTIEFTTSNSADPPPAVLNVDLILETAG